jgi:hypothetical protein
MKKLVNGAVVDMTPQEEADFLASLPQPPSLESQKTALKVALDGAAESARLKYITGGAGQALTYSQKADEAMRYVASAEPVATDYPLLSAEIGITAPTIGEVATIVAGAYAQWQQIGAAIEATRLGGKAAVDAAETVEAAKAIVDGITWP